MTLRRLGLRADQMKITMVYDIYSGTDHAYLVVNYGRQTFVLDSREKTMNPHTFKKRYQPYYAFNEKEIWTYKRPKIVLKNRQSLNVLPSNR
jgi:predicted transglutaminase-like cysteine proteinase